MCFSANQDILNEMKIVHSFCLKNNSIDHSLSKVFYKKSSLAHNSDSSSRHIVHTLIAFKMYANLSYNTTIVLFSFTDCKKITLTFCLVP